MSGLESIDVNGSDNMFDATGRQWATELNDSLAPVPLVGDPNSIKMRLEFARTRVWQNTVDKLGHFAALVTDYTRVAYSHVDPVLGVRLNSRTDVITSAGVMANVSEEALSYLPETVETQTGLNSVYRHEVDQPSRRVWTPSEWSQLV